MKFGMTITIALASIMLSLSSCKKDKDEETNTDRITRAPWILTAASTVQKSDGTVTDNIIGIPACNLDDRYIFNDDKSYEQNTGPLTCSSAPPSVLFTGTWSFEENETKITVGDGSLSRTFGIQLLNSTTMKLVMEDATTIQTVTYSH